MERDSYCMIRHLFHNELLERHNFFVSIISTKFCAFSATAF